MQGGYDPLRTLLEDLFNYVMVGGTFAAPRESSAGLLRDEAPRPHHVFVLKQYSNLLRSRLLLSFDLALASTFLFNLPAMIRRICLSFVVVFRSERFQ